MKVDPINFIFNPKTYLNKKFFFITGNEITLMDKIKTLLIDHFNSNENYEVERLKEISLYKKDIGLFNNNKVCVISSNNKIDKALVEDLSEISDVFIFYCENSPKTKSIKNIFIKRSDALILECYELSKESKITVLSNWLNIHKVNLDKTIFWELIEKLDNRYLILERELEKILEISDFGITQLSLNKALSKNTTGSDKIFFDILNKNNKLVDIYNKKVVNDEDFGEFYFNFKQYCMLIINNDDEYSFVNNVPKYLFREKSFLLDIFKKYNSKKKNILLNLIYNTEKSIRKNGSMKLAIGLRLLLGFKKITIS